MRTLCTAYFWQRLATSEEDISKFRTLFVMFRHELSIELKRLHEVNHQHSLYAITDSLAQGLLKVSNIHTLYYATYGNPEGIPIVVLHGGPGAGCQEAFLRVFDPRRYYVIMFDQRGSMRSLPLGCIEENTPQHSVKDMETLREHLKIEQWVIFGGSWGAALAILYGQNHPERCLGFILRGVFLGRQQDYLHLFYGMGKVFPEAYAEFVQFIPTEERHDLLLAYYRRVMDRHPGVYLPAARIFMKFDLICGSHLPDHAKVEKFLQKDEFVVGVSRLFLHYSINEFFLKNCPILSQMKKIKHLPAILVHGRWDAVCLPEAAFLLHKQWDNSQLWFVTQGGHSSNDPAIAASLATATDEFANRRRQKDLAITDHFLVNSSGGA